MASEPTLWWTDWLRSCFPGARQRTASQSSTSPTHDAPAPTEITSTPVGPTLGPVPMAPQMSTAESVAQPPKEHNPAISALKTVLTGLHASLSEIPPLQLAIGGLLECIVHLQLEEQNRQAYEELLSNLANLATLLEKYAVQSRLRDRSSMISDAAQAISEQTNYIKEQQSRSRISRFGTAKDDEDSVLKCYRKILVLFQQLQTDISVNIYNVVEEHQMDSRLERLSPAHDAWYNAALETKATKRVGCTENTRVELLDGTEGWSRDSDAPKIYWLNGMAGTGKTTIAYSLCQRLDEKRRLGASFFCSRNSPHSRNVNRIIPTIAYQLGRYLEPYREALYRRLENDPDVAKKNITTQFEHLISKPLTEVGKAMPHGVMVVIDALDECTDIGGTTDVLNMLLGHAANLPIKFFVTSRPEPAISERMLTSGDSLRSILRLHEVEKSLVEADIKYLTNALARIQITPSEVDQLAARSGSFFIFAATAVRYIIPDKGPVDHRQRLATVLKLRPNQGSKSYKDIDELYSTILSNALDAETFEEKELAPRQQVLRTVVCAKEPLAISALAELLQMPDKQAVHLAIQLLQSVLHLSETTGIVSTLHASFPDFLLTKDRAGPFYCDEALHNSYLADCCFTVMTRSLRFNICGLESSYQLDGDVPDPQPHVSQAISTGLFYSCRYWGEHLIRNPPTPPSLYLLESFLQNRLLFWMEVLNLKRAIGHGESVLSQALGWIPTDDENVNLRDFAYDARNFLTTFAGNPTSLSTPHIYISTLPFTSNQSLVYRTYWPRTQGLIRVEGTGMEIRGKSALASWAAGNDVNTLALSKDGRHVISGSDNNEVSVWDISSGTRILGPLEGHNKRVWSVAYSPDNTRIASGSEDRTIRIWHAQTGDLIAGPLENHSSTVRSVAFSPDGVRLASGSEDATIRIWDGHSGAPIGVPLDGHQGAVRSIAFSPDGQHLVSGSDDNAIRVWNWQESATPPGLLEGHTDAVYSLAYSSDGLRLASGSKDLTVRVWDMSSRTLLAGPFEGHTATASSVAFSPNGTRVVSGSHDKTIRVWEAVSGTLVAGPFEGHGEAIQSVLFTADGTRILSGSDDDTIRVWDARHKTSGATDSSGHTAGINSIALSPGGTRVASGSADKTICVWDTRSDALVAGPFTGHTAEVNSVAFSPDGARIVSGSSDRTLRTWDASTGALLVGPIEGHTDYVRSVAFSPDGSQIASGSDDATIRLWNSHTGESIAEPFKGHTHYVMSIAFSPDGAHIVSGSYDDTVRMWDANDGTTLWTSDAHTAYVRCVAFSHDGARIAFSSWDYSILVLDAADGAVLHGPFTGHTQWVNSVAFSPDGTRVVSGSFDQTVRVWDVESGTTVAGPLKAHRGTIRSVAFSPDGARIISGSTDHTIRVWDLAAVAQASPSEDWSIDDDGWLTNSRSQRLFWVPSDLRDGIGFLTASSPIAMSASWTTRSDLTTLLLGDRWHECYDRSLAAVAS